MQYARAASSISLLVREPSANYTRHQRAGHTIAMAARVQGAAQSRLTAQVSASAHHPHASIAAPQRLRMNRCRQPANASAQTALPRLFSMPERLTRGLRVFPRLRFVSGGNAAVQASALRQTLYCCIAAPLSHKALRFAVRDTYCKRKACRSTEASEKKCAVFVRSLLEECISQLADTCCRRHVLLPPREKSRYHYDVSRGAMRIKQTHLQMTQCGCGLVRS
eukprot:IDg18791t1